MPSKSHCKICNYDASSQRMLARHVAIAHASVVYKCPLCPFVSCYKANFHRHKREIHGLRRSNCETCGFEASSFEDLIQHQETVHPGEVNKTIQKYQDERERLGVTTVLQNNFPNFQSDLLQDSGNSGHNEIVNGIQQMTDVDTTGTSEIIDVDVLLDENLTELIEVSPDVPMNAINSPNMELEPLKVRRQYTCTCGLNTTNPREFLAHRRDEHGEKITIYECKYCIYATKNVQKLSRHCGLIHKSHMEQTAIVQSPEKIPSPKKPRARKTPAVVPRTTAAVPKTLVKKPKAKVDLTPILPPMKYPPASSSPKLSLPTFQKLSPAQSPISFPITTQRPPEESEMIRPSFGEEFTGESSELANQTSDQKYKCRNCTFSAKSKFLLVRHEKTVHLRKKFYRCQMCGYVCHEKGRYTKHIKYHSLPKTKCDFCDFETPYKWNLDRHLKNHELGGEFQCDKCSFTSHNRQSLTVHLTNHHGGSNGNPCIDTEDIPEGEDAPLDDGNLSFHEEENNDEEKEPDELDDMMPPEEEDLIGIQDDDDDDDDDDYLEEDFEEGDMVTEWNSGYPFESEESYRKIHKCGFCQFKTIWPQALRKHQDVHKLTKKYPCHLCGISFDSVAWLGRHLNQKHHQNVNTKSLTKFYASKKKVMFKPKSRLSAPPTSRFGVSMRQVDIRKQSHYFERSPRFLNKPPMSSQNPERYNKPVAKRLSNKPSRTIFSHPMIFVRPVQNGKPIHICRMCGYKTRWVSEIEKHLRVHSEEKPFSCPCCMYKCKWKGDLKRHVFKYHGEDALSLIEEPDAEDLLQDERCPPWSNERFQPPVTKPSFNMSRPTSNVMVPRKAKFNNGKQISQWKRVPTSKRSSTVLKLSKSSDQDSPLDLTTPRDSDFDYEEYGSYDDFPEDDEEYENAQDEETHNESFGNEWSDYGIDNGIDENISRNFGTGNSANNFIAKSSRKPNDFPVKDYSGKNSTNVEDQSLNEEQPMSGSRYGTKRYKCTFCPFLSKTASRFHVHIIQHLNKKPFMCSACGYKSNWEWDITKHIKIKGVREENHANAEMLITDDSGLKNYEKYNKFLVDVSDSVADDISESTSSPEKTSKPAETDTGTGNIVLMPDSLTTAETTGENSDVLPTDMMETEFSVCDQGTSNHQRLFKCKHCDFVNNEKKAVIGHLGVHAGLKPYRCKLCGMMSNWKHVIIRHVKLRHGGEMNIVEDRITYTQEGDTIKLSGVVVGGQAMSAIQKNDSSPTVFPCSLCPYTCEKHYYMQFHMKQHRPREDANLKCPLCPYWVKFKKTLTRHMKLHEMPMYVPFQEPDQQPVQQKENELNFTQVTASVESINQGVLQQNRTLAAAPPKKRKRHQCEFCPYATNNMTQFLYHKQFHRPNKNAPFKCNMCSYWATHNHLIIQHAKLHNNTNTAGIPDDGVIDSAYSVNHGGEFVKVINIAKKPKLDFPTDEMYQVESETENKYSCTMCTYQCNDKRSLSTHYRFHQVVNTEFMDPPNEDQNGGSPLKSRGFSYFCKNCPAMFKSRSDYVTHSSFHGAWLPFSCPHCDYKARHKPHLHKHLHVHSDDYVAKRESSSVPLSLGTADASTSDVAMPNYDQMPFLEEEEEKKKKKRAFLSDKLTSRLGLKQLKCTTCPAIFYKPATFQYHVSLHGSGLEHACTICNYAVGSQSGLSTHLRLHHKKITVDKRNPIKILSCPNCPAVFTKQVRFEKHLSLHGEKNKYTCDLCDYSVKFAANLSKHKTVHTNPQLSLIESPVIDIPVQPPSPQVPSPPKLVGNTEVKETTKVVATKVVKEKEKTWYNCSRCPYAQTRKDAVNSHQRRHGIRDGLLCSHCDYCTMQTSFLRDHMKRHFQQQQYLKIQAYMKCGPMEIWLSDKTDKELIFKYAGEETEESTKFFPEHANEVIDDQEMPSTNKSTTNIDPESDNNNNPDVEHEVIVETAKENPVVEHEVIVETAKKTISFAREAGPANVEKKPNIVSSKLKDSKLKEEEIKKKLIKDALKKTKKLEIVLTDVFQEKKNFIKPRNSDGKFKIPDLSLIGRDKISSSKSEKKASVDRPKHEDALKPVASEVRTNCASTVQTETCFKEKSNEKKESDVVIDFTPTYFEDVGDYVQEEIETVTASQVPVEIASELSEDMVWTETPSDPKDIVKDVMIGGIYPETPENLETVTTTEDILSDKDSDETIPTEEHFMEEVPDENNSVVVPDKEPSAISMEVTIF